MTNKMHSVDADNLRNVAHECREFLRDDILQALDAAADKINRLQEVVIRLQKEKHALKIAGRRPLKG
jgi:hypothetical protein